MNLNHVTLAITDMPRAIRFYTALGLRLIVESLPRYARFECPDGGGSFSVHLAEHGMTPSQTIVYFECVELDRQVESVTQAGIQFDAAPVDQPWLWREARLRDPDGNVICLYHAGGNRLHRPWRIDRRTS